MSIWRTAHLLELGIDNFREAPDCLLWHQIVSGSILQNKRWLNLSSVISLIFIDNDITLNFLLTIKIVGLSYWRCSAVGCSYLLCLLYQEIYTVFLHSLLATTAFLVFFYRWHILGCFLWLLLNLSWVDKSECVCIVRGERLRKFHWWLIQRDVIYSWIGCD